MIFWILTPPPPGTWVPLLGGGSNFFAYCGRCVCIWTWVRKNHLVPYPKGLNCQFNPLYNHYFVQ